MIFIHVCIKIYIQYIVFSRFFSIIDYYKISNIVLCAISQVLISYLSYRQHCAYSNPELIYPTPSPLVTLSLFSMSESIYFFSNSLYDFSLSLSLSLYIYIHILSLYILCLKYIHVYIYMYTWNVHYFSIKEAKLMIISYFPYTHTLLVDNVFNF